MNGAEIIWRTQYPGTVDGEQHGGNPEPLTRRVQYLLRAGAKHWVRFRCQGDPDHVISCGKSQIFDYRGNVISEYLGGGETSVSAIFNIDGLRDFRLRAQWQNLAKDLRVEEYKVIYDSLTAQGGIYPRNLCMEDPAVR